MNIYILISAIIILVLYVLSVCILFIVNKSYVAHNLFTNTSEERVSKFISLHVKTNMNRRMYKWKYKNNNSNVKVVNTAVRQTPNSK